MGRPILGQDCVRVLLCCLRLDKIVSICFHFVQLMLKDWDSPGSSAIVETISIFIAIFFRRPYFEASFFNDSILTSGRMLMKIQSPTFEIMVSSIPPVNDHGSSAR